MIQLPISQADDKRRRIAHYDAIYNIYDRIRKQNYLHIVIMAKFKNPYLNLIGVFVNVAIIIFGFVHVDKCQGAPIIPAYLIVAGILNLLLPAGASRKENYEDLGKLVFGIFKMVWAIMGFLWVREVGVLNHEDVKAKNYCSATVFTAAVWINRIAIVSLSYYTLLFVLFLFYKPWTIPTPTSIPKRVRSPEHEA